MNPARRFLLVVYSLCLTLILVYVPWKCTPPLVNRNLEVPLGYSFVWSPPSPPPTTGDVFDQVAEEFKPKRINPEWYKYAKVDFSRLALEIGGISALGVVGFLFTARRSKTLP
jgi:hypothetical protein